MSILNAILSMLPSQVSENRHKGWNVFEACDRSPNCLDNSPCMLEEFLRVVHVHCILETEEIDGLRGESKDFCSHKRQNSIETLFSSGIIAKPKREGRGGGGMQQVCSVHSYIPLKTATAAPSKCF